MRNEEILRAIKGIREKKKADEIYDAIRTAQEIEAKIYLIAKLTPDITGINDPLVQIISGLGKLMEALRALEKEVKKREGSE